MKRRPGARQPQIGPVEGSQGGSLPPFPLEGEPAQFGCPCTLKLWEAQGPRTVTLGNVTFPVSQQAAP